MQSSEYIGRKMKFPKLQEKPAIIVAAFGSSRRGKAALDDIDKKIRDFFPDHQIFWGYTSEIIRKKTKTPSLHETLAKVVSDGFRKAVVLPLQIFPGIEYREIADTARNYPGINILVGETLMHRWDFVKEVLSVVESDFLEPQQGLNLLALHGTPMVGDPANSGYLGLERMVADKYENVLAASLEGVPDHFAVMEKISRENLARRYRRVRILPMMYIAGLHVEDDLMGETDSWKTRLQQMGFEVECPTIESNGEQYFKSLASYHEIQNFFIERIRRTLELMKYH